jgi:proline dehydrogenase
MNFNQSYRSFVLGMAQNPRIKNLILTRGRNFARRFIAGDTLEEALQAVEALEHERIHAILDLLGEMVTSEVEARRFQNQLLQLVRALGALP